MSQEVCVNETSLSMSRKRRLDHLSWEEKLQRKKLKNRVAAQTSRDRKKAKMDDMDDRLRLMEVSNLKLSDEMRSLRELNERLLSENRELKERLGACEVGSAAPVGPAASPLPQEGPAPPAPQAPLHLLALLCLLYKISSPKSTRTSTSTVLSNLPTAYSEKLIQKILSRIQLNQKVVQKNGSLYQKWWGPHQSTWNPMKLSV